MWQTFWFLYSLRGDFSNFSTAVLPFFYVTVRKREYLICLKLFVLQFDWCFLFKFLFNMLKDVCECISRIQTTRKCAQLWARLSVIGVFQGLNRVFTKRLSFDSCAKMDFSSENWIQFCAGFSAKNLHKHLRIFCQEQGSVFAAKRYFFL